MDWIKLQDPFQIPLIKERSSEDVLGIAIFKHSTRCLISKMIKKRVENRWDFSPHELPTYCVDLLAFKEISNAISREFEIRHESPQLLLIKNGQCIYHASHTAISVEDLAKSLPTFNA